MRKNDDGLSTDCKIRVLTMEEDDFVFTSGLRIVECNKDETWLESWRTESRVEDNEGEWCSKCPGGSKIS